MRFLVFCTWIVAVAQVRLGDAQPLFEGYSCREGNLPNQVRVECHPESNATKESCWSRGCVWCDAEESSGNYPACFFKNDSYVPPGPTCDEGYMAPHLRVDCAPPGEPIGEMGCRHMGCTWCPDPPGSGFPWCFRPGSIDSTGYVMVGEPVTTPNGVRVTIRKTHTGEPQWEGDAPELTLEAEFQSDYRLRIKITDGTPRFEVPIVIYNATGGNANTLYDIEFTDSTTDFSFKVTRKSTGAVLFDSSAGKLIFADQFLSMAWHVPTENVYGLGENEQRSLKHNFADKLKYTLYASDLAPFFTASLYGTQPHYTVIEADGSAHAVVLVNSNSQEFQMLPGPMMKYITIGGIFDMYFFLGPTPDDTVRQYTEAVGRAQFPPYWGLGFQLCRWGYDSIENMQAAVNRTAMYGIPQDVQYGDIDIMRDELDFTYDMERFAGLPQYIRDLKSQGIKFVTILDPFISIIEPPGEYEPFELGEEMDVWYKRSNGSTMTGRCWPHDATAPVYYPDYSKNSTREWWIDQIEKFHDLLEYDGLWIDMNEPANFEHGDIEGCDANKINYPPYKPGYNPDNKVLYIKTLCPDHVDSVSIHYNTHSLYGWFESEPTLIGTRLGTGKRSLVLSRSTFLGSGKWTTHWLGDNWSHWSNMHFSIIGVIQFNLWGIPYVGPDICGFIGDSNAALCNRWMQLGAFYPFSRNHNVRDSIDQDPGVWGAEVAANAKAALEIRYTLLPYLYTLFYHHVTKGTTVFRPLWYNYVEDTATLPIDRQFMWGTGLLVSPVITEGATSVEAYFPDTRFYSYYDGEEQSTRRGSTTLTAPTNFIPLHIAGGNILPTQQPARNTEVSRQNPFGLIIALDDNGSAEGAMFYDDGDSIDTHLNGAYFYAEYSMSSGALTGVVLMNGYEDMATKVLQSIRLFGALEPVNSITVNGDDHTDFRTDLRTGEVQIENLNLQANNNFAIVFN